jgi:hypothetical protein
MTGKLLFFQTEFQCSLPVAMSLIRRQQQPKICPHMYGASTDIARLCLWNPASSQAQIAPMLTIISIYSAVTEIQDFQEI